MRINHRKWLVRMAAAVMIMCVTGCGASEKEKQMIQHLTTDMQTTCMGRYLIDLPRGMDARGYVILYYGLDKNFKTVEVTVKDTDATPQKMAVSVAEQAAEIARSDNRKTKKSMLLEHKIISNHAIYLRYHRTLGSSTSRKRELHLLTGKTYLKLFANSFEGLDPDPEFPYEPGEKVDERLFHLASQIRAYDDPETAGPGFCLGPVAINSDHDEENASFYFPMDQYPDLLFSAESKVLTPYDPTTSLLQRMQEASARDDVHVLRQGETTLGGMHAQEWLASAVNDHDNKILHFATSAMRPDPAFIRPQMSFRLKAGGQLRDGSGAYVNSSLTPREGVALWDAIIKSVRLRPNAVAPRLTSKPALL